MGVKGGTVDNADDMEALGNEWKKMFQEILPTAATSAQVRLQLSITMTDNSKPRPNMFPFLAKMARSGGPLLRKHYPRLDGRH
jgi:hypothetical protein